MNLKKMYYNKYIKLKINTHLEWREITCIDDLNNLEYASKRALKDLYELNKKRYNLAEIDYEYFYRAMCKFAIGLNKMDSLKIQKDKQDEFSSSFEKIHNDFEELKNINMMRDYL